MILTEAEYERPGEPITDLLTKALSGHWIPPQQIGHDYYLRD